MHFCCTEPCMSVFQALLRALCRDSSQQNLTACHFSSLTWGAAPRLRTLRERPSRASGPAMLRSMGKLTFRHTSVPGSRLLLVTPYSVIDRACKAVGILLNTGLRVNRSRSLRAPGRAERSSGTHMT